MIKYQVLAGATQTPCATFVTLDEAADYCLGSTSMTIREIDTSTVDAANDRIASSAMRKRVYRDA